MKGDYHVPKSIDIYKTILGTRFYKSIFIKLKITLTSTRAQTGRSVQLARTGRAKLDCCEQLRAPGGCALIQRSIDVV